jgi:proteasome lid subunit RPN8/RPN11
MKRPRPPIYLVEDASITVLDLAQAAAPFETGGLILGVATSDSVWITGFTEVTTPERHVSRFRIPAGVTHAAIDAARIADSRIGYIGDWHSHPTDAGPSTVDLSTLRDLAVGALGRRRLLGLVRRAANAWALEFWALDRLRFPTRARVEPAGPLPPV